jgi:hypothetical protein
MANTSGVVRQSLRSSISPALRTGFAVHQVIPSRARGRPAASSICCAWAGTRQMSDRMQCKDSKKEPRNPVRQGEERARYVSIHCRVTTTIISRRLSPKRKYKALSVDVSAANDKRSVIASPPIGPKRWEHDRRCNRLRAPERVLGGKANSKPCREPIRLQNETAAPEGVTCGSNQAINVLGSWDASNRRVVE